MKYSELLVEKHKKSRMAKWIILFNVILYVVISFWDGIPEIINGFTFAMILIMGLVMLIPIIMMIYMLPSSIRKNRELYEKALQDHGEQPIKAYYSLNVQGSKAYRRRLGIMMIIFYGFLACVLMITLYRLVVDSYTITLVLGILAGSSMIVACCLWLQYSRFELILTDTHLIYNFRQVYSYEQIGKHQIVKLIKDGYILDMNMGSAFFRVRLQEEEYQRVMALTGLC